MHIEITDDKILAELRKRARAAKMEAKFQEFVAVEVDAALRERLSLNDLTPTEVAKRLGIHKNTLFGWIARGLLPGTYYINSRVCRIPARDVEKLRERTVYC